VALIAAGVGLVTALMTLGWQGRTAREVEDLRGASAQDVARLQQQLAVETRQEERFHAAAEQLNRYREPLLAAARDVAHRLGNIRAGAFLTYLHHQDERRRIIAVRSTLYRFGRYWAVVETLAESVSELRFATEEETKRVAFLLARIGSTFASDAYASPQFMVWREEQRGIADLLRDGTQLGEGGVMGFARFMEVYDTTMAPWFTGLEHDLQADNASTGRKLEVLQGLFEDLTTQLETGRPRTM